MMNSIIPIRFKTVAVKGTCVINTANVEKSKNGQSDNNKLNLQEMSAAIKTVENLSVQNKTVKISTISK